MRPIRTLPAAPPKGVRSFARRFAYSERGASMAEYALLLGAVALVALVGARSLGVKWRDSANLLSWWITSL